VRDTIRHLFAFSGNRCAFMDCAHPLIDQHGCFIAEVCHIEAAEPGGPRFNAAMTNEERRRAMNLMLLCHRHHVESDDEVRFPVAAMQDMKARHEQQFEESVAAIAESALVDITKQLPLGNPQTLKRLSDVLGWRLAPDERQGSLDEMLLPMLERFRLLAPETRGVLLVIVERGQEHPGDLSCPLHEIEQVTRTDRVMLEQHIATLERYGIAALEGTNAQMPNVITHTLNGWPFWRDLRAFCTKTGLIPAEFIVDLRFDLLD